MSEAECDQLLDRSDLYARWEEDRKRRSAAQKEEDDAETAADEENRRLEMEAETSGDGSSVDQPGLRGNGVFAVVETTCGINAGDLV